MNLYVFIIRTGGAERAIEVWGHTINDAMRRRWGVDPLDYDWSPLTAHAGRAHAKLTDIQPRELTVIGPISRS